MVLAIQPFLVLYILIRDSSRVIASLKYFLLLIVLSSLHFSNFYRFYLYLTFSHKVYHI
ncbi:hypothetical protein FC40_GL000358 [Ligilactobacillus hayakitensis DSM 18933 = JCM 14209]|uniref:Uncharacterized protein n=1 Tax=Ligilactobacillus hayakitensis DSM 18933 = JCM 14209 TaxID=1423755 RepID=A0A0R1WYH5_9LACO|nr:hypothetical protein FC40_GL000358 [Ligilactobacillus hayakitensis DSM 18933 = JCM 14209]